MPRIIYLSRYRTRQAGHLLSALRAHVMTEKYDALGRRVLLSPVNPDRCHRVYLASVVPSVCPLDVSQTFLPSWFVVSHSLCKHNCVRAFLFSDSFHLAKNQEEWRNFHSRYSGGGCFVLSIFEIMIIRCWSINRPLDWGWLMGLTFRYARLLE